MFRIRRKYPNHAGSYRRAVEGAGPYDTKNDFCRGRRPRRPTAPAGRANPPISAAKKQQDQPSSTAVIARSEATWQSRGSWCVLKIDGIATPHLRLAMTEVDGDWSFYFRWRYNRLVGGGNAARPTVRIPYAERAVSLDCRQSKSIRHALGSRPRRDGVPYGEFPL